MSDKIKKDSKFSVFRWKGLIVFIALLAVVYFSLPSLIKMAMESTLEASFDAKATIAKIELDYSNSKLSIHSLTVADSEAAFKNLFEFSQATLNGDFFAALTGRFIIDEMSIVGLQFETDRATSGLIAKQQDKKKSEEKSIEEKEFSAVSSMQALPSADELLANEPLKTIQLSDELEQYIQQQEKKWQAKEEALPTETSLKDYESQLKALQKAKIKTLSDFKQAEKSFNAIKKQLKQDRKGLQQAQEFLQTTSKHSQKLLAELKDAPAQDLRHLKSKYSLSENGALNITGLLFGGEVQEYSDKGLSIYKRVKPLISSSETESSEVIKERLEGRSIHFGNTKPSFWIKILSATGKYNDQDFSAKITDITHQPHIINQPIMFELQSNASTTEQEINIHGKLDYRIKKQAIETLQLTISAMPITDWRIVNDKEISIEISAATLNAKVLLNRLSGVASGTGNADYSAVKFNNEGANSFSQEMAAAIAKVDAFNVSASFENNLDNLSLSSDLDKKISKAINARLKAKQDELEKELNIAVSEELKKALEKNNLDGFISTEKDLDKQLDQIESLLEEQLDSYVDQEKAKQKKKADEKLKKEQDKLKKKLKSLF